MLITVLGWPRTSGFTSDTFSKRVHTLRKETSKEDNNKTDLQEARCWEMGLIKLARDGDRRQALVNLRVP
jgi:hypothetical protein